MNIVIELAQRIEDNQKMHLESIFSVFALALVMAPAPQMAAISFATQTQDPNEHNVTLLICKVQVASYFIDLILDSRSSVSVIAKHFLEAIRKKINKPSIQSITNVHDDKKKNLSIAKAVSVHINGISIKTDMKVFKTKEYTIIVGNKWLKKAKALLDYELCELTIRCGEKPIVVKCYYWTTPPVPKQNQKKKQSNESNDDKSNKKENQEEQKKLLNSLILFLPAMTSH
ncbi:hypothetical protein G9A89_018782 [Geosiphon pyriformis]|nr:hypothetical protein G9A89_018782 [Geosiphon pyriformis]